ncbi:MAG: hypothetical protein LBF28_03160, partial [Rickettsiales bacterium]|nr:hypothetical protein [Rickettsiales bacterium]
MFDFPAGAQEPRPYKSAIDTFLSVELIFIYVADYTQKALNGKTTRKNIALTQMPLFNQKRYT